MSETTDTAPTESPESPVAESTVGRRWWVVCSAVVLLGVALGAYGGGFGKMIWGDDPAPVRPTPVPTPEPVAEPDPAPAEDEPDPPPKESREEAWQRDAIGRWKTYYKGDRFMTVREDGTATIEANLVEYSWLEKKIVGAERVTFEIVWTVEDGALTFDTVGGEPVNSVNVITSIHGKSKTYPIVHVTETEFRYQSDDPEEPDYVWERIPTE